VDFETLRVEPFSGLDYLAFGAGVESYSVREKTNADALTRRV
jgi:hypothetical protein